MKKAYLGIGTNLGDRMENLRNVICSLRLLPMTNITAVSNIYETTPVGYDAQDDFLNIVVEVETDLTAEALLGAGLGIEAGLGRVRGVKNGPRIVDVDLLIFENETYNTPVITVPHPRMWERDFVLVPLLDIDSPYLDKAKILTFVKGEGVKLFADNKTIE